MQKSVAFILLFLLTSSLALAQRPVVTTQDSIPEKPPSVFKSGFYPLSFFDFDLRYLIKYNNYEGIRLGMGGTTNDRLFESLKFGGYFARGFKDQAWKYSFGGSIRLAKEPKSWLSLTYIDDIAELGSFFYLTDARVYNVFEPRLVNISQFYKHRTWTTNYQQQLTPKILAEFKLSRSNITQIEDYQFEIGNEIFSNYVIAEATASFRFSPKTNFFLSEDGEIEYFDGFPKITAQVSQGLRSFFDGDFEYIKLGLKLDYYIKRTDLSSTNILLEGKLGIGDIPLTHLFHAFPNSPTKDRILQRFSVAGRQSFETMYFGEFFSDKLVSLQLRHALRRFYFSDRIKPELVFISRHALGSLVQRERHLGLDFNTLEHGYNELGMELNKIFAGFGLSFAYRYGAYYLPEFEDNISFKFTFYLSI